MCGRQWTQAGSCRGVRLGEATRQTNSRAARAGSVPARTKVFIKRGGMRATAGSRAEAKQSRAIDGGAAAAGCLLGAHTHERMQPCSPWSLALVPQGLRPPCLPCLLGLLVGDSGVTQGRGGGNLQAAQAQAGGRLCGEWEAEGRQTSPERGRDAPSKPSGLHNARSGAPWLALAQGPALLAAVPLAAQG